MLFSPPEIKKFSKKNENKKGFKKRERNIVLP